MAENHKNTKLIFISMLWKILDYLFIPIRFTALIILNWIKTIMSDLKSPQGYKIFAAAGAAYIFFYNQQVQLYDHDNQRASEQYNSFMTLVGSGIPVNFATAMTILFSKVQNLEVREEPSIYNPFSWGDKTWKYRYVMSNWVKEQTNRCVPSVCSADGKYRIDIKRGDFNNVDIFGADFSKSDISSSKINYSFLSNIDFSEANISGSQFRRTRIYDSVFKNTDISCANFELVNMSGSRSSENSNINYFTDIIAAGTNFDQADLKLTIWSNIILKKDPEHREQIGSTIKFIKEKCMNHYVNNSFRNADFRDAQLENVVFDQADLRGANFSTAEFKNVTFKDCNFDERTVMPLHVDPKKPNQSTSWKYDKLGSDFILKNN